MLEFISLFLHAFIHCDFNTNATFSCVIPDVLTYLHGAELRSTHGTEVRHLGGILGQGGIVKLACLFRVQTKIELVFPAEFKTRLGHGIVTHLCPGVALGQVGGMRCNLVGYDTN